MLGNLNNVNETRHIGQSNNFATMPKKSGYNQKRRGEMDYQNKKRNRKNNLTASYTSTTDVSSQEAATNNSLQGETSFL